MQQYRYLTPEVKILLPYFMKLQCIFSVYTSFDPDLLYQCL